MNSTLNRARTHAPPATRSVLAICLAATLLAACGGGSSGGDTANASSTSPPPTAPIGSGTPTVPTLPTTTQTVTPATEAALAVPATGGVVDYFKQKLIAGGATTVVTTATPVGAVPSPAPSATAVSEPVGAGAFAGTTLQERGVDENDWVKTDGTLLYALSKAYSTNTGTPTAAVLQAQRRLANGQLESVGRVTLPSELTYSGMYLVGSANRLALVGQRFEFSNAIPPVFPPTVPAVTVPSGSVTTAVGSSTVPSGSGTAVTLPAPSISLMPGPQIARTGIDLLATPANGAVTATLSVISRIRIDGSLVGSRVIGSTLYVVSNWQPDLRKYAIPANATPAQAQAAVAGLTAAEILPTITIDGGTAQPLVAEGDCYVQAGNVSLDRQVTTITAFNLASASLQRSSRCFLGGSQALYMSPAAVYLASSRYFNYGGNVALTIAPAGSKTDIHKFALAGQSIDYRGTGEVAGHLGWDADKNAYRMSEHQGDLRVLTFTGAQGWSVVRNGTSTAATPVPAASPATLTVLREASSTTKTLQVVATLPNAQRPAAIGKPGEQVYAVQFVGPRAYVVTFKRTDPLYVLDLSNAADPKTIGELEIPGYSDYLYPLGDTLLLGVGKDANDGGVAQGVKVALMDVADPTKPSIRSTVVLGKRGSASGLDSSSRGINLFQQGDVWRIALPVRLNETPVLNGSSNAIGFFDPTTQGLARFEVDTKAKTMVTKPMVTSLTFPATNPYSLTYGQYDLGQERSVQIESFVYYFSGGSFRVNPW